MEGRKDDGGKVRLELIPPELMTAVGTMITWHVHADGLHIWKDGKHVGVIERRFLGELLFQIAKALR